MGLYMTQIAPLDGVGHPLYQRGEVITVPGASTTCTAQGIPTAAHSDSYPTVSPVGMPTGVVRDGEQTPVYSAVPPVTNTVERGSNGGSAATPTITPTETGGGPKSKATSADAVYTTVAPPSSPAPESEGPRYTVTVAPPVPTVPGAKSNDTEECDHGGNTGRDDSGTTTQGPNGSDQVPTDDECATDAPADDECDGDSDGAADECEEHPTGPAYRSTTPATSPTLDPTPTKATTISVMLSSQANPVYPTAAPITDSPAATPTSTPVETGVDIIVPSNVYGTVALPSA